MLRCCARCKVQLSGLRCDPCGLTYPAPAGIPVLVCDPARHVADSYVDALHNAKVGMARATRLREGGATYGDRVVAETGNVEFFESVMRALGDCVEPRALAELALEGGRAGVPPTYSDAIPYALRDWGGADTSESELRGIDERLRALLPMSEPQRALVLGAGAGRTSYGLRDVFADIVAIDLSFAMAFAFTQVREAELTVWDATVRTDGSRSDAGRPLVVPETLAAGGSFEYWVADAAALPLEDASVDVVCCVYFLDVLRLSTLAAEVRRVLRPGGALLNVGPLVYHHDEVLEHLEPPEVKRLFRSFDLNVVAASESWQTVSHLRLSAHTSRPVVHSTWSFRADFSPRSVSRTTLLRHRAPIEVRVAQAPGNDVMKLLCEGKTLDVEPLQADVVRLLDGTRTVEACLAALAESYELSAGDEERILLEIDRLRTMGLLEWVE